MLSILELLISVIIGCVSSTPGDNGNPQVFIDDRDGSSYQFVELNSLNWMKENLRFKTTESMTVADVTENCEGCGEFYAVNDALSICPKGWRLPTEKEVKGLFKWHRKNKLSINESLSIRMCGRVDNGKHAKAGAQNTFWMNADLIKGEITHWHTFGEEQELHSHNVVAAERQFPVRCVCELE